MLESASANVPAEAVPAAGPDPEVAAPAPALTLVSHHLCPYVQRAAIVLAEKGVPFQRRDIDLADRPDWFRRLSPLGKVPLLMVGDTVLFESAVIVEYLEETQPRPLHPADPLARARHRAWMEFGSSVLSDIWVVETTADRAAFDARLAELRAKLGRLEGELGDGPFFAGDRFSVVDAVFAPAFRYFDVFDTITDLGLFDGLQKVTAWRRALSVRPSVVAAAPADYPDRLRAFLRGKGGVIARSMG